MYLGSRNVDELLTFTINTHTPSTSASVDADSLPTWSVYEEETGTAITTGTMAKLDDAGTLGHYSDQIDLDAADYEWGKTYTVRVIATVGGVSGAISHTFDIPSLEKLGLLYKGEVTTVTSQTQLVISTPRSTQDDDYLGSTVLIRDVTNVPSASTAEITDYDQTSGTITIEASQIQFTITAADVVEILPTQIVPTANDFVTAFLDLVNGVEPGLTVREFYKLSASALFGKSSGHENNNPKYRDFADLIDRINANTDSSGNRTSVTLNKT